MAQLSTPQQQAGIMSFYDAPSKGPLMDARFVLIAIVAFAIIVIVFDHVLAL